MQVVLIIHYFPINVFVLSILGYVVKFVYNKELRHSGFPHFVKFMQLD